MLLVPLFLRAWGAQEYGAWLGLYAIAAYLNLVDLGGQAYIGNLLTLDHALGDERAFRRHLSEGFSVFLLVSAAAFVLAVSALVVAWSLPRGFGVSLSSIVILALLFAVFAIGIPGGVYVTAYRASDLFVRGTMVGNSARLLGVILSITLLALKVGPIGFAAGLLCQAAIGTTIIFLDTRRVIPLTRGLVISRQMASSGFGHLRESIHFSVLNLSQTLNQQGIVIVIAAIASPAVVAVYATHRAAALIANYVNSLFQGPLLPEFGKLHAQRRDADLRRVAVASTKTVMLATGVLGIGLWVAAPVAFASFTSHEVALDRVLLAILLAQGTLAAGWTTIAWALYATNRQKPLVIWSLVSAGLMLGLAVLIVHPLGARGAAIAGLSADVIVGCATYPRLAARSLSIPVRKVYGVLVRVAAVLIVVAGAGIGCTSLLPPHSALVVFATLVVVFAYPIVRISLGADETARVLALIRRGLTRKAISRQV